MTKRKFTMDRIVQISDELNDEWLQWNERLKRMYLAKRIPRDIYKTSDILRQKYANIITLAKNWRFLAEANNVDIPDED